jgi:hypothetical protein
MTARLLVSVSALVFSAALDEGFAIFHADAKSSSLHRAGGR